MMGHLLESKTSLHDMRDNVWYSKYIETGYMQGRGHSEIAERGRGTGMTGGASTWDETRQLQYTDRQETHNEEERGVDT